MREGQRERETMRKREREREEREKKMKERETERQRDKSDVYREKAKHQSETVCAKMRKALSDDGSIRKIRSKL